MKDKEQSSGEPGPKDKGVEQLESAAGDESGRTGSADDEKVADVKDVQQQADEHETQQTQKFGTLAGVFTPTLLTILGVIMFLREGWVVGNAGLGGAWLIILLSFSITAATGLSMATFVTNIRVGPGGAFSMISQSLGLEAGGAIGAPLYFSQALAVVMYIFGFREGYLWAVDAWGMPALPPIAIDLLIFAVIFGITMVSTGLAFKVQYAVLVVIVGALVSVAIAVVNGPMDNPITWWGDFRGAPENDFSGVTFVGRLCRVLSRFHGDHGRREHVGRVEKPAPGDPTRHDVRDRLEPGRLSRDGLLADARGNRRGIDRGLHDHD